MAHGFWGTAQRTFIHERDLGSASTRRIPVQVNSPIDAQFLAQVLDHLVARTGLPAAAPADWGVFDLRWDLYGDKHRARLAQDLGQSGGELLEFPEGAGSGGAGAPWDYVVVGTFAFR